MEWSVFPPQSLASTPHRHSIDAWCLQGRNNFRQQALGSFVVPVELHQIAWWSEDGSRRRRCLQGAQAGRCGSYWALCSAQDPHKGWIPHHHHRRHLRLCPHHHH
eukprot:scaffold19301_cov44-Phaeocystis_antarctica.AAC.1